MRHKKVAAIMTTLRSYCVMCTWLQCAAVVVSAGDKTVAVLRQGCRALRRVGALGTAPHHCRPLPVHLQHWPILLDTRYSILDTRYSILDTRYSILDTRYSILDTRYSILDTRYSILDPGSSVDTRYSILDTGQLNWLYM